MHLRDIRALLFALLTVCGGAPLVHAAQTIRVVCYNIEADISGVTTPRPGLYTVLEAIGENYVGGAAHPLDILTLEETTSNATTVAPIVSNLNTYYNGAATYAQSSLQGTETGGDPTTGNGPNAIVYNTKTLKLLASAGVGTPTGSGNGEYRQVMRYEFQPVGGAAGTQFYVYVSHAKSSSGGSSSDPKYRGEEAAILEADFESLPTNGGVLSMGDFNMDGSTEAAYKTFTAKNVTASGTFQFIDPLNPTDNLKETWDSSTYLTFLTESCSALDYRDDIQFVSAPVYNGTSTTGLQYVSGSYNVFGNNGSVALGGKVTASSNTAPGGLQGSITAAQARAALNTASDHLPVVCDYVVVSPTSTPYSIWQSKYFSMVELGETDVSGDDADPDGDGVPNLVEYALGMLPRTASVAGLPTVGATMVGTSEYLTLTYVQIVADTDITYMPQVSGDLETWESGANAVATVSTTTSMDGTTQTVTVRDLTAMTAAGARFMRLEVTRP